MFDEEKDKETTNTVDDTDTDTDTEDTDNFTCCPDCGSDNIEDTNPDDLDSDEVECNNCGWIGLTSDLARG